MYEVAVVSPKGVRRWQHGHPWIFRSDLLRRPSSPAGPVRVEDQRGKPIGVALWSPASEISLRMVDRDPRVVLDHDWWTRRIGAAIRRRAPLESVATAYRVVHGEGDGCPSLICDRYDRSLVIQLMSAGLESFRDVVVDVLDALLHPTGILARNDVPLRSKEHLPVGVELLRGSVPEEVEVSEHGVRFLAAPWRGQKTGAFLDQRENRVLAGEIARGRALDCFSYHGSFALHLARRADSVVALDVSADALRRAGENCARNAIDNVTLVEADAFDYLREQYDPSSGRFETIVLDPPAFAKNRAALPAALRGYKEINLRALRLLTITGQPLDHPEVMTIPETGYLKGAVLEVLE
jgi:23S rRNA (cytosine1962-C5)-methyltransferase